MALASGSKLGPYEVVSPLGAGGIGEICWGKIWSVPDKSCRFKRSMQHFSSRLTHQSFSEVPISRAVLN